MNIVGLQGVVMFFDERRQGKIIKEEKDRVTIELPNPVTGRKHPYSFAKSSVEVIVPLAEAEKIEPIQKKISCKYCGSDNMHLIACSGGGYGWGEIRCNECGCTALSFGDDSPSEETLLNDFLENYYKNPAKIKVGGKYKFRNGIDTIYGQSCNKIFAEVLKIWNDNVDVKLSGDVEGTVNYEIGTFVQLIEV